MSQSTSNSTNSTPFTDSSWEKSMITNQIFYSRQDMSRLAQRHPEKLAEALTFCISILKSQLKPADFERFFVQRVETPRSFFVETETGQRGFDTIAPILSLASEAARDAHPTTILAACTMLPPEEIAVKRVSSCSDLCRDLVTTVFGEEIVEE